MHDICLPHLPVLIGIDRAGFVGEDGETHHGLFDIVWLRALPNITFAAPRDATELNYMVKQWYDRNIPMAIRYPRGTAPERVPAGNDRKPAPWLELEILRWGTDVCLFGLGSTVGLMLDAADKIMQNTTKAPTVVDLRFIKPLDLKSIGSLLRSHKAVITAEEGAITGGVGEAISAYATKKQIDCKVVTLGAPDRFVSHATRAEQWEECGLTAENILSIYGRIHEKETDKA